MYYYHTKLHHSILSGTRKSPGSQTVGLSCPYYSLQEIKMCEVEMASKGITFVLNVIKIAQKIDTNPYAHNTGI
jgi:hypothetical protein